MRQKLGYKFRQCELQKIPYKIIVGEKEMNEGKVSVNIRKEGDYRLRRVLRTNLFVHNRAAAGSTPKVCPRVP